MSLKTRSSLFGTVTLRLTLWYAGLFSILSLTVFVVVYVSLTSHLGQQADNGLLNTAREFEALYEEHGLDALQVEFRREAQSNGTERVFFQFLSPAQEVLAASDLSPWEGLRTASPDPLAASARKLVPAFQTLSVGGHRHKVRVLAQRTADDHVLLIGTTLVNEEIMMERYRETFGTALAIMLVFGSLVGWLVARRAMSGVQRVTHTATQIGKEDLRRRVPLVGDGEEIDTLVHAFNNMLGRIQTLVEESKEVTDNVAHELRSPLTRIRGIAEMTLTSSQDIEAHREMAATIIEESDALVEMINTMLEIAMTDSGIAELGSRRLDLRDIAGDAADLFQPVAQDKGVELSVDLSAEPVTVVGDRAKLQRAVANLLDNAVKFTEPGGRVCVSARRDRSNAMIEVADTGTGIDEKDIPRVFDRLFRSDRSRSAPGSGLGLTLARAIVRAHGGDITVASTPDRGSTFRLLLPHISPLR